MTTRNVHAALAELARTIEPHLMTTATPTGILAYARNRTTKCRHLQGDGNGGWACNKHGSLAQVNGISACALFSESGTPTDCPTYQPLKGASQLQHLYALSAGYEWMRGCGAMETNPVPDARRDFLRETQAARTLEELNDDLGRLLSDAELEALLAACGGNLRRILQVMAKTGLRIGEAIALRVPDISLAAKPLRVPVPNSYCNKRRGLRVIRMASELLAIIQAQLRLRRAQLGIDALFTNRYGKAFSTENGKQDINKAMQRAAIRAGIQDENAMEEEHVTPHCMRRWFSNQLGSADLGGVGLGVQVLLRGDRLPGALSRYLDQPALAEPL